MCIRDRYQRRVRAKLIHRGVRTCSTATTEFQTYTPAEASAYTVAQLIPAAILLGVGWLASREEELTVPVVMTDNDYTTWRRDNAKLMRSQDEREQAMIVVQKNVQANPTTKSLLSHWDSSRQVGGKPSSGTGKD
eukprot:TRINITY_DN19157_c0_g1_i1.p1 TRINITY_DN19157_c0_g1~~TRINITY_DN19157_c0_g1_i1.p1  ORF type:complete len:135 (-),score=29.53 TRINITY_DN19157_c0_g1_i1:182-586(-)